MNTISLSKAIQEMNAGTTQIIDVREPLEFKSNQLDGAVNLPSSTFKIKQVKNFSDKKIVLVCQSGGRANMVLDLLKDNGIQNAFIADKHMGQLENNKTEHKTSSSISWTVDRQFRMTLGVALAIFLIGFHFAGSYYFIIIPLILATGLIVTSIIDRCYMRMGIAMLPWNRDKENIE